MNKKLFFLLVVLMSLSLIGIIFVQGYWIKSTVDDKEEQFSYDAKQVLIDVADQIQNREIENYYFKFKDVDSTTGVLQGGTLTQFFHVDEDKLRNEVYYQTESILEEDYKVSSGFLKSATDSIQFTKLFNKKVTNIIKNNNLDRSGLSAQQRIEEVVRMDDVEKEILRSAIGEYTKRLPVHERVSEETIRNLLKKELEDRDIKSDFEFGVYNNSIATNLHSDDFSVNHPATYGVPLFVDSSGNSDYQLLVNFTGKKRVVLSSVTLMAALSIIFTLIIVVAYSSALSQLIRQRQISQIKTDFINNMTHEFKTPIATINLALDAIKNPRIINDQEKVTAVPSDDSR